MGICSVSFSLTGLYVLQGEGLCMTHFITSEKYTLTYMFITNTYQMLIICQIICLNREKDHVLALSLL